MPYPLTVVIRKTKAPFLSHALETATAPMHSILSQEKDYRCDNECQKTEDKECAQADEWEKLIDFVLDIGDHFQTAELTYFFHWSTGDTTRVIGEALYD
jgi:hypothetical protein